MTCLLVGDYKILPQKELLLYSGPTMTRKPKGFQVTERGVCMISVLGHVNGVFQIAQVEGRYYLYTWSSRDRYQGEQESALKMLMRSSKGGGPRGKEYLLLMM